MGSKRDREDQLESDVKRQKVIDKEEEAGSPQMHAFENPLLPLASYDDVDDEEEERKREAVLRRAGAGNGIGNQVKLNGDGRNELIDDDDEEEDEEGSHFSQGKRNRSVEVRRDCPYLDTVNRQVFC